MEKVSETNQKEGCRYKKQTEWDKVDCYHERGGGLLSIDWLEDLKK